VNESEASKSVRPSVTCRYYVETAKRQQTFSPSGSHTIPMFSHQILWQYSDEDLPNGSVGCRIWKKSRFSTNISLYLGNSLQDRASMECK